MPLTAAPAPAPAPSTLTPGATIPPDLEAVLHAAPIHPELLRSARRPAPPTAAVLTRRALDAAARAVRSSPNTPSDPNPLSGPTTPPDSDIVFGSGAMSESGAGSVITYTVGAGGALRLHPGGSLRALTVAFGVLHERGTSRPALRPGTVRLVPAGMALTLAELSGRDAVVVEVAF